MATNKYYKDELDYLRRMGREFAKANPSAARFLAEKEADPDVERLLEGFAFLSGKIREKLDDEFPELTHGLINLLWPHYLRPIPSMSILEFTPIPGGVMEQQRIEKGKTEVASLPVDGTSCLFRTCYDVDIAPMTLEEASLEISDQDHPCLRLLFAMSQGITFSKAKIQNIRLFLSGDPAFSMYLWLCRYVKSMTVRKETAGQWGPKKNLPAGSLRPIGFGVDEGILPYPQNAFIGYRLLQEYFCFPQKFLFVEFENLTSLMQIDPEEKFEIRLEFSRQPESGLRISRDNFRLNCTPIVNLFSLPSDPIQVDHGRVEYLVRPERKPPTHYEIYKVENAKGFVKGSGVERVYEPFFSFKAGIGLSGSTAEKESSMSDVPFFQTRLRRAVVGEGTEFYVAFVTKSQKTITPPTEIVECQLTCTNRTLPSTLKMGDISKPTESSPVFARFHNISQVTTPIHPPLGGDLYWRFLSHLSLNYISLVSVEGLRGILELYNFQSQKDRTAGWANARRIEGIADVKPQGENWLFKNVPVRGTAISVDLLEDHFAGDGDMYLFASILNEFFALYASLNSFTRLTVRGKEHGERYEWAPQVGQQMLL